MRTYTHNTISFPVIKTTIPGEFSRGAWIYPGHNGFMANSLPLSLAAWHLQAMYPDAHCELVHTSAFELLVATVLSAQTTDVRVNQVTPTLFSRWPSPHALAGANEGEVSQVLRPLGMGARRATQVIGLSRGLCAHHGAEVPDDQRALEALPGVGRKTAHVVRGTWFGHSLLTVDTHVGRLARRFGWSESHTPLEVEKDVVARAGNVDLTHLSHQLIFHGRRLCTAKAPVCQECPLATAAVPCPRIGVVG